MRYISTVRQKLSTVDFPVFTLRDVRLLLESKRISEPYLYLMIHNLIQKGEITRLTRAVYTFHDDAAVVGFSFRPFYYGFENALNIHGISDQGANFTVVTPKNVRAGLRKFKGRNYVVRKIRSGMFFGYAMIKYNGFWIPVSDLEKTLIDMLYFNSNIRDELWPGILKQLNMAKLKEYLQRYDGKFRKKVLDEIKRQRRTA